MWLEFHGDSKRKVPPDAAAAARLARGRAHEREVVAGLQWVEPNYPRGDFAAGARATSELLSAKTPLVYQGVLAAEGRVGLPDLLRFDPASGRHIVGDVKASSRGKVEHAMQVAFYSELLATLQGSRPSHAFLVLSDGKETAIALDEVESLYRDAIEDVERMRGAEDGPRAAFGPHCSGCGWRNVCLPEMRERGDLSLVVGMTPARRDALEAAGAPTLGALAASDSDELAARTELPRETLRRLRLQAAALLEQAPKRIGPLPWKPARIAGAAAIAADPRGTHFSEFFFYRTTRVRERLEETWHHAAASGPAEEEKAHRRFLAILAEDRDAPIYHFGPALPDALAALDAKYGRSQDPTSRIFERLVDVQSGLRSALVLPVNSYDLDSAARALGVVIAEVAFPADDGPAATEAFRRRAAAEVKAIREVRVAAGRAWSAGAAAGVAAGAANVAGAIDPAPRERARDESQLSAGAPLA